LPRLRGANGQTLQVLALRNVRFCHLFSDFYSDWMAVLNVKKYIEKTLKLVLVQGSVHPKLRDMALKQMEIDRMMGLKVNWNVLHEAMLKGYLEESGVELPEELK